MGLSALYVGRSRARKDFFGARLMVVIGGWTKWCGASATAADGCHGRRRAHVLRSRCRRNDRLGACRGVSANAGARSVGGIGP